MNKLRKLALTAAALAALAVGGAAFAQAQSAGPATTPSEHQVVTESGSSGEQESGSDGKAESAESASEQDSPEGAHDRPDSPSDHESAED